MHRRHKSITLFAYRSLHSPFTDKPYKEERCSTFQSVSAYFFATSIHHVLWQQVKRGGSVLPLERQLRPSQLSPSRIRLAKELLESDCQNAPKQRICTS